ncbi:MAG: bifunctional diaminohydroxyphosphoribosylaminopyrimidine deaminase/5-amino-6-(5-phosphoribosylamino)uracil reductase RibD, partial [Phycisphaerae bacterium]
MAAEDERFMTLALELAERGRGAVEPNPMVGAVLARDGRELARGWHQRFGGPHAEIEAFSAAAAAEAGAEKNVRGATMYVTLEPCCHHGKTPPCTDALIATGLKRVVVAMPDVDARVAGG